MKQLNMILMLALNQNQQGVRVAVQHWTALFEQLSKTTWPSSGNDSKGKGKEKPTYSKAGGKWPKKGGPGNHGQQKKKNYIVKHHSMYNNSVYLSHWYYPFLFIQKNHCDVTINNGVVD